MIISEIKYLFSLACAYRSDHMTSIKELQTLSEEIRFANYSEDPNQKDTKKKQQEEELQYDDQGKPIIKQPSLLQQFLRTVNTDVRDNVEEVPIL